MEDVPESTLRREDVPSRAREAPVKPHLFVVLECSRPAGGGARYALSEVDEVVVGRAAQRKATREGRRLVVGVPDGMMSSSHARIVRTGGWVVQDRESKNGTFVDGVRVSTMHIEDGALVEMGGTLFTLRWLPTPPSTPDDADEPSPGTPTGMSTLVPSHADALASLRQVMATALPLLLLGDTGTGKELLARAAHQLSGRPGAFIAVNCGAIPATLVESQLFGHSRGAFSGATRDEPGFVRASDRGTLFLDEIGDLPASSQAALLRVLQEGEVVSVGSTRPVKVDLRVVSATHRPVDALTEGQFRADLYARLAGYVHRLLPLGDRREDLGVVLAPLLRDLAPDRADRIAIEPEAGRALYMHAWPRNVRELRHVLASALVFATDGRVTVEHLPPELREASEPVSGTPPSPARPLGEQDTKLRASLVEQLTTHAGNVSEVARAMGRTRMQIHRWMRRFGIEPESYRRR